ncbi:MAG: nicotinate (nicotinamide) nucleotide adenylyltransferase [Acidobacteria bacterium]|nr:nicotinate (nicotinamide) nucleotide adenylyltransferase [Acidobacteriota bacterium]
MNLGVYGGTFDPVHTGHLAIAHEAVASGLVDEVLFVPAAHPPHKRHGAHASFEHRFRMIELACAGDARLLPSRLEEGEERSYTIRTLERLSRERPGDRLHFVIGADAFAEIHLWHRANDVMALADFVVVSRPGHTCQCPEGARIQRLDTLAIGISSSEIRRRLRIHRAAEHLPPGVLDYIVAHGLYTE